MHNACKIIEDLLPSYMEGLTSEESTKFIEEHLATCTDCKKLLQEMREEVPIHSPTNTLEGVEEKALAIAQQMAKYQNGLKLSLCIVPLFLAVIIVSIPVSFLNTLGLLVLVPFACTFFYKKSAPLYCVSLLCAALGGRIIAGSFLQGSIVGIGQFLLMSFGVLAGGIFRRGREERRKFFIGTSFFLLGAALFVQSLFSGTPIGYIRARSKVAEYIGKSYMNLDKVKIKGIFYNWKDTGYIAEVANGTERFTIQLYGTGYIADHYNRKIAQDYQESYSTMIEAALQAKFPNQYFWVVASPQKEGNPSLKEIAPTENMDLIIRFAETKEKYPTLSSMSKAQLLQEGKKVVEALKELKLSYHHISFQARDTEGKEIYLNTKEGLKEENILDF